MNISFKQSPELYEESLELYNSIGIIKIRSHSDSMYPFPRVNSDSWHWQ